MKAFYTTTSKQVLDIHDEARRIHETHKTTGASPPSSSSAGSSAPSDATTPGGAPKTAEAPTVV